MIMPIRPTDSPTDYGINGRNIYLGWDSDTKIVASRTRVYYWLGVPYVHGSDYPRHLPSYALGGIQDTVP